MARSEVRYDKLLLMSCFPEVDPSPKWAQIAPARRQLPPSRNRENWAGTSVQWEGFPGPEASGWPTQDPVLLSGRKAVGSPHPAPLIQPWKGGWAISSGVSPITSRLAAHLGSNHIEDMEGITGASGNAWYSVRDSNMVHEDSIGPGTHISTQPHGDIH